MTRSWKNRINRFEKLQDELVEAAESLDESKREEPGICGTWSAKEVLAHLSGWNKEIARQFALLLDGRSGTVEHDIDRFNRQAVREREHLNWRETLDDLKETHRQFNRQARSISRDNIAENEEYAEWMSVQIEHYEHHLKQLKCGG